MEFTLMELRLLTSAIVTEIIRREEVEDRSEEQNEKIATFKDLAIRIDEEKMAKFLKKKGW